MGDAPRIVELAMVARGVGAVAFDLRRKWARNGSFLRLRLPDRESAYSVVLAGERLGFACAAPIREGRAGTYQLCVTVPDADAAELRTALPNGMAGELVGPRGVLGR